MSQGLEALHHLRIKSAKVDISAEDKHDIAYMLFYKTKQFVVIEKELKALETIKDFVWIENGEIHLGLYGDSEIVLRENDLESKEKYDLLKEVVL